MIASVPFAALAEATGPVEGVEYVVWDGAEPPPRSDIELVVLDYRNARMTLDRLDELPAIAVVQTQTAGVDGIVELIEHRRPPVPGLGPVGLKGDDPVEQFDGQGKVLVLEGLGGPVQEKIGRIGAGAGEASIDQGCDPLGLQLGSGLGQTLEQLVEE